MKHTSNKIWLTNDEVNDLVKNVGLQVTTTDDGISRILAPSITDSDIGDILLVRDNWIGMVDDHIWYWVYVTEPTGVRDSYDAEQLITSDEHANAIIELMIHMGKLYAITHQS